MKPRRRPMVVNGRNRDVGTSRSRGRDVRGHLAGLDEHMAVRLPGCSVGSIDEVPRWWAGRNRAATCWGYPDAGVSERWC